FGGVGQRGLHLEAAAWRVARRDGAAVRFRDAAADREPEAQAASLRPPSSPELDEDGGELVLGEAGTPVAHAYREAPRAGLQREGYGKLGARVSGGVAEEVGREAGREGGVDVGRPAILRGRDLEAPRGQLRPGSGDRGPRELRQVDGAPDQLEHAGLDAAQRKQVLDDPVEPVRG